jgi:SDR family mycofactocin-dependent oxidoreductase
MDRVRGKVALITGAARGQGRSHAVRLAEEGADIIAIDACAAVGPTTYPPATRDDLATTVAMVQRLGRRIVAEVVDVRDLAGLTSCVARALSELGRLDIVVANAGICSWGRVWELTSEQWSSVIDINLTGVWHTLKATVPAMIEAGRGGSIVVISSVAGLKSLPAQAHYSAAKHGLVGLTGTAAIELAAHGIRVNSVHPWAVRTAMAADDGFRPFAAQIIDDPRAAEPRDISDAVLWLASDESRTVTGIALPIDLGATRV